MHECITNPETIPEIEKLERENLAARYNRIVAPCLLMKIGLPWAYAYITEACYTDEVKRCIPPNGEKLSFATPSCQEATAAGWHATGQNAMLTLRPDGENES